MPRWSRSLAVASVVVAGLFGVVAVAMVTPAAGAARSTHAIASARVIPDVVLGTSDALPSDATIERVVRAGPHPFLAGACHGAYDVLQIERVRSGSVAIAMVTTTCHNPTVTSPVEVAAYRNVDGRFRFAYLVLRGDEQSRVSGTDERLVMLRETAIRPGALGLRVAGYAHGDQPCCPETIYRQYVDFTATGYHRRPLVPTR